MALSARKGHELPPYSEEKPVLLSRNKHWRKISFYDGPWTSMSLAKLQAIAQDNLACPSPRYLDPTIVSDLLSIRQAIDEANSEILRANLGTTSSTDTHGPLPFSQTVAPPVKMSKERIHKIRQKAVGLLAKAYSLDEIAACVMTMKGSSAVDGVAEQVFKRDRSSMDAQYVMFFHEKFGVRQLVEGTPPELLTEIMSGHSRQDVGPVLRTRGTVNVWRQDYEAAVADFSDVLALAQKSNAGHQKKAGVLVSDRKAPEEKNASGPTSEECQPTGLEQLAHYERASAYLNLACEEIERSLDGLDAFMQKAAGLSEDEFLASLSAEEKQKHDARLEARKRVKVFARRAYKDYMAFLSFFDYTPGYSPELKPHFKQLTPSIWKHYNSALKSSYPRGELGACQRQFDAMLSGLDPPAIYRCSELFAEKPDFDFPSGERILARVTHHPFLLEAVYELLITHALLQTSPTELQRHALHAARLNRLAVDSRLFDRLHRPPARTEWCELIRLTKNWISLPQSWDSLCGEASAYPEAEQIRRDALFFAYRSDTVGVEEAFGDVARRKEAQIYEEIEWDKKLFGPEKAEIGEWEGPITSQRMGRVARWVRFAPRSMPGEKRGKKKRGKKVKSEE